MEKHISSAESELKMFGDIICPESASRHRVAESRRSDLNNGEEEEKNATSWCKSRACQKGLKEASGGLERSCQFLIIYT